MERKRKEAGTRSRRQRKNRDIYKGTKRDSKGGGVEGSEGREIECYKACKFPHVLFDSYPIGFT